jgi:CMP-N,N'-diacetyllegionaminic acid synthase
MNVLCTICARGGSAGVKNKNIRKLCGKPLIAHSIIQAQKTKLFDLISVSSDSPKIRSIAKEYGADHVVDRPAELASSTAPKLFAIQHAVLETERAFKQSFDYIVDLDATSPLRSVDDIIQSINMLIAHKEASNLVTACPSRRSPYFNMLEINAEGFAKLSKEPPGFIARRQDVPESYDMNASIYIWERDALFSAERTISDKTLLYVMPEERSIDVDSILDWKFVSLLARERKDLSS